MPMLCVVASVSAPCLIVALPCAPCMTHTMPPHACVCPMFVSCVSPHMCGPGCDQPAAVAVLHACWLLVLALAVRCGWMHGRVCVCHHALHVCCACGHGVCAHSPGSCALRDTRHAGMQCSVRTTQCSVLPTGERSWHCASRVWGGVQGHSGGVMSVCFSPDGRQLASGSYDMIVRVWEVSSGACTNVLEVRTCVPCCVRMLRCLRCAFPRVLRRRCVVIVFESSCACDMLRWSC